MTDFLLKPESTMESHDDDEIQQSPTVSLEVETENEDLKDSMRTLTEKLSAALANVSAKDDLVKQHVKVAEEAVAGINLFSAFIIMILQIVSEDILFL